MKIKICGLKRPEDVDYVNQAHSDWAGFVFAGTRRKIDYETACQLKLALDPGIVSVGVFVNAESSFIIHLVEEGVLDMVQLHGDEDRGYIETLRSALQARGKAQVPIIKAVRVRSAEQVLEAQQLPVEYLLLDAFTTDEYGGSGKVFDHELIPKLTKPYILAGGIDSKNVNAILRFLSENGKMPVCIDVSSSVETNGYKDKEKIKEMVAAIRQNAK